MSNEKQIGMDMTNYDVKVQLLDSNDNVYTVKKVIKKRQASVAKLGDLNNLKINSDMLIVNRMKPHQTSCGQCELHNTCEASQFYHSLSTVLTPCTDETDNLVIFQRGVLMPLLEELKSVPNKVEYECSNCFFYSELTNECVSGRLKRELDVKHGRTCLRRGHHYELNVELYKERHESKNKGGRPKKA